MIILGDRRRQGASQLTSITTLHEPLTERTRRAVAAAAAVERGDVDLDQATRRYGIAAGLIEAWQHALQPVRPARAPAAIRAGRD